MLGTAIVVLLFLALLARPWVRAMRGASRRRAEVQGWGPALGEPPAGAEAEPVVLRGQLEADEAIPHLRGLATIAATLHGSPSGDGHLQAEGLRLRLGEATIPIEGRVEVRVGATEEHPRSIDEKTEYRFAESKTAGPPKDGVRTKRAQLRRVGSGASVIVRGHIERRAADGGQYREGAHGWALVTGKHGEPVEVAAESPQRVRLPTQSWALRALGIGTLIFVLLPLGLEHGGEQVADQGNDTLRDCDHGGHSWLRAAEWMAQAEGAFPGFGEAALKRRARTLGAAVNGIRVCRMNHEMPVSWVEPLIEWGERTLPAITDYEHYDGSRSELESTLHQAGLDRAIVALQDELPRGGEVSERVRAHLYLGDLEGAVATWNEPEAHAQAFGDGSLQEGVVLCMGGHEEAMDAFERELRDPDALASYRRRDVLFQVGMCALRMGELERVGAMADAMSELDYPNPHQAYLRGRLASLRGEPITAPEGALETERVEGWREAIALLAARQLADTGEWERLLRWLERSLGYRLDVRRGEGAAIFNPIFAPPFDDEQLATLAETMIEGANALERAGSEEDTTSPVDLGPEVPSVPETLRQRAGEIHRYRAALLGRRWDPRAEQALDAAERLLGRDEVQPLRQRLAFFHGDWERTKDAADREIRNLSRIYLGEPAEEGFHIETRAGRDVGLTMLNPSDFRAEHEIASLYFDSDLSDEERWAAIRDQEQSARWPVLFYRLTHVITHGENLGMDVSAHREQLEALRALVDEQPEVHLFMGPEGEGRL